LNVDQGDKKPLLESVSFASAVSNNLKQIAYSADSQDVWITNIDKTDTRTVITDQLRQANLTIARISWSPKDDKLAILAVPVERAQSNPEEFVVYIVDLSIDRVQSAGCAIDFDWTNTGDSLIFNKTFCQNEAGLYLVSSDDLTARRVFRDQTIITALAASPVKDEVAFIAGRTLNQRLFLGDWSADTVSQVLGTSEDFSYQSLDQLAWSPDGERLAFIATVPGDNDLAIPTLFTIGPKTQDLKKLSSQTRGPLVWSPTGGEIATTVLTSTSGIYQIDSETGQMNKITEDRLTSPLNIKWK
jgi:Tol biopolymer transport system component